MRTSLLATHLCYTPLRPSPISSRYDDNPSKLQLIIRSLYGAIKAKGFQVDGTTVKPFPMFEVLDGKNTEDYCQRVEPSVQGGEKMARAFLDQLPL